MGLLFNSPEELYQIAPNLSRHLNKGDHFTFKAVCEWNVTSC